MSNGVKSAVQVAIAFLFLGGFFYVLMMAAMNHETWAIILLSTIAVALLGVFGVQVFAKSPEEEIASLVTGNISKAVEQVAAPAPAPVPVPTPVPAAVPVPPAPAPVVPAAPVILTPAAPTWSIPAANTAPPQDISQATTPSA